MGIKKNQTAARVILTTGLNLQATVPTTIRIYYTKPNSTTSYWDATILLGSETLGKIYVDFDDLKKFNASGTWKFWSYFVFADGRIAQGDTVEYEVKAEGQL
jgi:hypothetical protein